MTKQDCPWGPKELTEKLVALTSKGRILWSGTGWGFRALIMTESPPSDVVIDLEYKEGDSGSEFPYVPPISDTYALYIKSAALDDLFFWNSETDLIKPLWMAANKQNQPKNATRRLGGKTYFEINQDWPNSRECVALQKALQNL